MTRLIAPDVVVADREHWPHAPSWSGGQVDAEGFLSEEHRGIYEACKDLPGWQDPQDSQKLYEMAYWSGSVILEIGVFGGRSAVIELRGAMAGARDRGLPEPQFFGVDVDPGAMYRGRDTIGGAGLLHRALLYHGNLEQFLRDLPIVPTMVFVDGDHRYEGCKRDLEILSRWLAPGTPVLCHDYYGIEDVRRAVDEWIVPEAYDKMGQFAGAMLLRATGRRSRWTRPRGLSEGVFGATRAALLEAYLGAAPRMKPDTWATPTEDLTAPARQELQLAIEAEEGLQSSAARVMSGCGPWPYGRGEQVELPPTMPGGKPWPKISIITPTRNQAAFIEETILSVRHQNYPNVEHIVIDGGSTDGTQDIVRRYIDRIAHFVSEPDRGQSDAINKGMRLATGEILTWLNSDDMLAPGALAAAALALSTSGADMVAGECHVQKDGRTISRHLTGCGDGPLPLENLLDLDHGWNEGQFFYQPEVLFTRGVWERAGGHVREDLYYSMDYELWLRFARAGARVKVIGRPVCLFRAHEAQKTAEQDNGGFKAELPKARAAFLEREGLSPPARLTPATKRSLRVVLFNDLEYAYGAGAAHRRLAEALRTGGHQVSVLSAASPSEWWAGPQTSTKAILDAIEAERPDLVVLGNFHGAGLSPELARMIARRWATAIVMHDAWWVTGRCPYTSGCTQYLRGCGPACTCPQGYPKLAPDEVAPAWELKRQALTGSPGVSLWANSQWAADIASGALDSWKLGAPPVGVIKFGFELDDFRPRDRAMCREMLDLPRDRFIIMTSATSTDDRRKGLSHLAEALQLARLPDVLVIAAGHARGEPPIPGMRMLGYVQDRRRLAMMYGAADVFVGPSLEEAFGQVFIEAAACGVPSAGYAVGGKPEAIIDGMTGRLAREVKPEALTEILTEMYRDAAGRAAMGAWARVWAENEWSMSASYSRLVQVMRQAGVWQKLGLGRRIGLSVHDEEAPTPRLVAPLWPAWRAVEGFDPWEGPYPELRIGRCRWACGPRSVFEIDAGEGGAGRLVMACRCASPDQRVRFVQDGRVIGERVVAGEAGLTKDLAIAIDVVFKPGMNRFELEFWRWDRQGERPLAVLLSSISAVMDPSRGAVEVKPGGAVRV